MSVARGSIARSPGPDSMKTDDLRAFDAVVRHGSISEAARAMGLTQPAITRRIQNLEADLGAQLLDRSTKPPRPSALGLRVYEQTRSALRELDTLARLVASDAAPAGPLRLGVAHSIASPGLIDVLAGLSEAFPEVQLQVSSDWSAALLDKVAAGKLDAAAVFMPSKAPLADGLAGEVLASTEAVIVAARGAVDKPETSLRRLAERGWIVNPAGCGLRAALQHRLAELGLRFELKLETFGSELQLGLVARGLGLACVSRHTLAASDWSGQVQVLKPRDFRNAIDVCLVGPGFHGHLERAVQRFGQGVAGIFAAQARPAR